MTLTDEQLADIAKRPDFLLKAAQYFRKRPTGGEDRAHWANVYNAENCEKMAMEFRALLDEVARQCKFEADALPVLDAYEHMHTRAVRAEAEVENLRKPVGKEEWP